MIPCMRYLSMCLLSLLFCFGFVSKKDEGKAIAESLSSSIVFYQLDSAIQNRAYELESTDPSRYRDEVLLARSKAIRFSPQFYSYLADKHSAFFNSMVTRMFNWQPVFQPTDTNKVFFFLEAYGTKSMLVETKNYWSGDAALNRELTTFKNMLTDIVQMRVFVYGQYDKRCTAFNYYEYSAQGLDMKHIGDSTMKLFNSNIKE